MTSSKTDLTNMIIEEQVGSLRDIVLQEYGPKPTEASASSNVQIIDLPNMKLQDDIKVDADKELSEKSLKLYKETIISDVSEILDENTAEQSLVSGKEQEEISKISSSNNVRDSLDSSICDQSITDAVKSALNETLDDVCNYAETTGQNESVQKDEIVVQISENIHGFEMKFPPKVPDLKDLLPVDVQKPIEPVPSPSVVPEAIVATPLVEEPEKLLPLPLWMPQPPAHANCPFGLEYLAVIDCLQIYQSNILPGFNDPSFLIKNNIGQFIYHVESRSKCMLQFFCASKMKYEMSILNSNHIEVMHFTRPQKQNGRRALEVFAPFGTLIGKIHEGRGPIPFFVIMDPTNEVLFRIEVISGPPEVDLYTFGIMPTDGDSLVGKIKQETGGRWKKILRENFIKINYYINLDAKIKALIMGACFLIDLIYFEMF